jgi:4-hydroxyproline epimerase
MACLAADGALEARARWRQEGILGTVFEGNFEVEEGPAAGSLSGDVRIRPTISGSAFVTAQTTLLFDPADPFRLGVPE